MEKKQKNKKAYWCVSGNIAENKEERWNETVFAGD